ncbi:MAG: hypothetical protein QOF29_2232 [bacterium]|jgi:hypothetical protein|nr:hypothetical protein [Solirubrobacteraceae bacterium]MEA2321881.1 hypothetical protein [Solirubrobacteraceae bacterium]
MPKTLIFTKLDDEADEILDAFGRRAGLPCRDAEDRRIFELEGASRDVDPLEELEEIDPSWQEHLRLENPQTSVAD